MMDMRQHSGGAMPANSLQYSPQSALSNENFFLLDPSLSNSPSMDLGSLNAPFPSQLTSDFSIFMESTSQNTFGMNAGSSMDGIQGQMQPSSSSLFPADEWSGTSNSALGVSAQHQQQIHFSSSSPSQGQSSLTHGPLSQSVLIETKLPVPQTYEPGLATSSLAGSDAFATQQGQHPINKGGQGIVMSGQGRLQGMIKQTNAQGSQLSSQHSQGANQQIMLQSQLQSGEGLLAQQSHVGNAISSHILQEASFEGIDGSSQQQVLAMNIQKTGSHSSQGQHATAHASTAQGIETESPANRFLNSDLLHRSNHGDSALGKLPISGMHLAQQTEQSMQSVRGLGLQLQEKLTRPMQTQLPSQYVSQPATSTLPAQNNLSNPHTINSSSQSLNLSSQESLRQNQTTLDQQNALQAQSQVQEHGQMQSGSQPSAFPSQTLYQGRQLQTGSQQLISQSNQSNSFHSVQSVSNQLQPNLQVNGAQQMVAQMQPRQMNTLFQALKAGGQQVLQRPAVSSLGFGSATEGNTKSPMPGAIASRCVQVLMRFIQEQRKRPADNDIGFWRNLVSEFFVPGATKRWCLSSYNSSPMGRHAQGLFPMDYWFCNLCGIQPGRGFASSTDVLPRLFKIKYASGLKDELLFLDMAEERYVLPNGKFVLEFQRAVHESIFPELRVVRYGRLRVTFSSSFKIFSWEFCTKIHEEVVPRKSLLQQAQQLARLVMDVEQGGFDKSAGNLKAHCNEFTTAAKQLASKLEAPSVNDLGFSKRYVRCLQIAEVVNSMKDLISFERKTGLGPIMSLAKFPSVRKLPEGPLGQSTLSQLINQLPQQGNASVNSFPNSMSTQGQISQHQLQPNLIPSSDLAISKNGQAGNSQLGSQARAHLGVQNDGPLYQYQNGPMQPPAVQGQSQLGNQLLSRLLLQGQQSQLMSSGNQSVNFSQLSQQIYESAGHKHMVQQSSNQLISQSHSLNQTGQQSLPGTPQSEMSDMRSNT